MKFDVPVDPLAGLFCKRTPEAAARQIAVVLAYLTECQLATLEGMQAKRSTPKGELARQVEICRIAVDQCRDLGIGPGVLGLRGGRCVRLDEALAQV